MKNTRLAMIKGDTIPACVKCNAQEEQGYKSMRSTEKKEKYIAETNADGSVNHLPHSAEIHFGNLCNLKCKMCSQNYSNQIGKELLEMGEDDPEWLSWVMKQSGNVNNWTNNLSVEYKWFKNPKIAHKLVEWISKNVTTLSILGGEPTIIPEFWKIFEHCEQKGTLTGKQVTIVTNLTNINPRVKTWLPKLENWTIWASIDGIGERTEYIRYPSNWNKIVENLNFYKSLLKEKPNGQIVFSPAISILNIDQLDDLLAWQLDFAEGKWNNNYNLSWMAQVWYPKMLNYDVAPYEYKLKIADKLEKNRYKFKNTDKQFLQYYDGHIKNLRENKLEESERKHLLESFIKYNDQQDKFRGKTTWRKLIPELENSITKYLSQS
jgi:MoaA/NifB/PqqE/SkfB family radical SAM enzyme